MPSLYRSPTVLMCTHGRPQNTGNTGDWHSFPCNNNITTSTTHKGYNGVSKRKVTLLCYRRKRHAILLGIPIENVSDGPKEAGKRSRIECGDLKFGLGRVGAHFGADGRTAGFSVQEGEF